jgi:hypothetical protein
LASVLAGRPLVVGLLLLSATGCTGDADDEPQDTASAVASYDVPPGAPEFCARLAAARHVDDIPAAVGGIAAGAPAADTRAHLLAAMDELRYVLAAVREDGGYVQLDAALDDLIAALQGTTGGRLTQSAQAAITAGLDDVGRETQPVCEFPT